MISLHNPKSIPGRLVLPLRLVASMLLLNACALGLTMFQLQAYLVR
jgi:hypothetical protein